MGPAGTRCGGGPCWPHPALSEGKEALPSQLILNRSYLLTLVAKWAWWEMKGLSILQ